MKPKIFIDGAEGTTGLRIADRLASRQDIELLVIERELRKDADRRKTLYDAADIVFLCLPDEAAREAASAIRGATVIDASTAHRTAPGWAYGFPELSARHREEIAVSGRIAVPGCHATGFVAAVYPLIEAGLLPSDYPLACHSLTGYSGGGKAMIAEYTQTGRGPEYDTPRQYALGQRHKHQPEMRHVCSLDFAPVFNPIVCDFYSGMAVTVPLHLRCMKRKAKAGDVWEIIRNHYANEPMVSVLPLCGGEAISGGCFDAGALSGLDRLEILVAGSDDQAVVISRFDNLGKGASGAAVQCMNIVCGFNETAGLMI